MYFVVDSDTLIKITNAGAKEAVASVVDLVIPPEVERETVHEGKKGEFPDALRIEKNIQENVLNVSETPSKEEIEEIIETLRLTGGEADVFRLFKAEKCKAIISDDQKFLDLMEDLEVPYITSSALLIYAWKVGGIKKKDCLKFLKKIKPMISEEEYHLSLHELEGGD